MPKAGNYTYVYSVGQIDKMLEKMKSSGRPEKLNAAYAKNTWLLKNAQFGAVVDLLKDMKFIDSNGVPTELYGEFQNQSLEKKALGKGTKNAFPNLFKAFPEPTKLSKQDLQGYLKQQTGAADAVVTKLYGTIKKMISISDLNVTTTTSNPPTQKNPPNLPQTGGKNEEPNQIPITMNIEIVIPSDATAEKYDQIFAAIKKHLRN